MVLSKNERADAIVRLATEPRLLALSLAGLAGLDIGKLGFGAFRSRWVLRTSGTGGDLLPSAMGRTETRERIVNVLDHHTLPTGTPASRQGQHRCRFGNWRGRARAHYQGQCVLAGCAGGPFCYGYLQWQAEASRNRRNSLR